MIIFSFLILNLNPFFFSVNMRGKGKVGMDDFELLKVLGTGGEYFINN